MITKNQGRRVLKNKNPIIKIICTLENFKADLDQTMSPILSTLHGNGVFKTSSVTVGGFPAFDHRAKDGHFEV